MEDVEIPTKLGIWRAIDISVSGSAVREFGIFKAVWGTDIWINGVPILKCIVAANIIVWIVLFVL